MQFFSTPEIDKIYHTDKTSITPVQKVTLRKAIRIKKIMTYILMTNLCFEKNVPLILKESLSTSIVYQVQITENYN